ncbi:aldehyde dehydrogenase family protein [Leisingera methylohalidivorans]|uniref:Gamma-glutamyl-gamma-aminobutyraldehyde dehydrogenase n=1 Tax=Leisingera methylohalidivorans DSM 14336 TaxID=999552 RepID=V9W0P4_9RHOB|nr:aldehyde dehydrogenase family protein [Leisingera methylohalidivorans]AHD03574.1 gamma-glutamyl-gamma-aminobutyraldehyde dehydrogenase [Leisingera methylohalidivorans DSM 14336]
MPAQPEIDALRDAAIPDRALFIGGRWVQASDGGRRDAVSPIDGATLTTLAEATAADAGAAVRAARAAFEDGRWSRMAPMARKTVLHRFADLVQSHALELAVLGVRDNGTEIGMALKAEPGSAAATIRFYAECADKIGGEIAPTPDGTLALVHREAIGVVGAIVPWNFPLMIGAWKIAPALAAGNSVVLKPAESAALSLLRLAELAQEAGIPDGVLNVVTGAGPVVGEAMGLHPDIDVLAFTGSGATGRRLLEYSARSNMKRCYLELGGKSPNIVFANAPDLEEAAQAAANGIFRNSGQVCIAGSRLLVENSIHDEFVRRVVEIAEGLTVGDPLSLDTDIGAVHSQAQLSGNLAAVDKARNEGGTVLTGGKRIREDSGGYYMAPTVVDRVAPTAALARNEVFGPVLAVTGFADADEAIALANGTDYGLSGAVWTADLSAAHRVTRAVKGGLLHVNTYGGSDITVPMAGMKQSGNGVDKSMHAFEKYTDLKTVWMKL